MALKAGYHGIKKSLYDLVRKNGIFTRTEQEILGAKNLNGTQYTTKTVNGVTFTVNSDGTVTVNGTATADAENGTGGTDTFIAPFDAQVILSGGISANAHIYPYDRTANARPYTDSSKTTRVTGQNATDKNVVSFWMEKGHSYFISLRVVNGSTVNNAVFKPLLRLATDPDDTYVPYALTNRELTDSLFIKNNVITSADDLDNIIASGIYSITTAPANSPEGKSYAALIVKYRNDNDITQLLFTTSSMYTRRKSGSPAAWTTWYKYSGTQVTPSTLTSASPETRSDDPELTEDEPIVKKTTKKTTKKTEEV